VSHPAGSTPQEHVKILVVEDDPLVRVVAVEALLDAGFEVVEAESGPEALEHCKKAPDALFTDIRLPGNMTRWDIADRCREENPKIPVIYATAYSETEPRPVIGSICFQKPYTPNNWFQPFVSWCDQAAEREPSCSCGA
jgi:CheY-like chemotaxis protein